ncbi:MAG: DUF1365 domain-containing protein [Candidatus Binatia bacterium]|nr:DUF1365 domain-containing protein [Candidatus Binatia bacterium]
MRQSCIYRGYVRHRRFAPVSHTFTYSLFLMYLDLDELPTLFHGRWLWSTEGRTLAQFRRRDHFGDPRIPLADAVRALVAHHTGCRPAGPIRLLTHLRYFGYCFNPVSFYFCYDASDSRVETIVAEVTNTPWGERYCYVLPEARNEAGGHKKRYRFGKAFHVSPFMGMDVEYDWRFSTPGQRLVIHMENHQGGSKFFDATMVLTRREISGPALTWCLVRYPFMTGRVIAAIYLQAGRLWLKRTPFYPHPATIKAGGFEPRDL